MLNSLDSARDFTKGTFEYLANETWEKKKKDDPYKCDVFSFGMLMYELFTLKSGLKYPIDIYKDKPKKSRLLNYKKLNTSTFDEFPPEYSVLKPLLQLCVKTDPAQRPTMKQIVKIFSLSEEKLTGAKITSILESTMMGHLKNSNSEFVSVYN